MSFLKCRAKILGAVVSTVLSMALLGNSLISANVTDNYKNWKQTNSSWSNMTIGTQGETVANIGCAVTSVAMLMVKSGAVTETDFNPAVLITYLNQNGGFSADGNLNWWVLNNYTSDFKFEKNYSLSGLTNQEKIEEVQDLLNNGYYILAQVKYGQHFVAVDYVKNSEITMMDPGSKSTSLNEKYGISSMTSLRLFKLTDSATQAPEKIPQETELLKMPAQESAPEFLLTAPATAPVTSETIPETVITTITETTVIATTTESTTTTTETETTTTTSTETTTTTTTTTPEIINSTKATTATTAETILTDIIIPAPETMPEIILDAPLIENDTNVEDDADCVQVVILQDAPEMAPDINHTVPTENLRTMFIPKEQAKAVLSDMKEQNLYMNVRFYIQKNLRLRATPDTDAEILNIIPEDTYLNVVEVDEDFKWGKVLYENQEGWISLDFTKLSPDET
ncbi:MAG: SH3 domain-containing protein [Oscillospiraceae bacterium]|nr:SH3 domain-containing protein [Oscillospiraceae bacterium]